MIKPSIRGRFNYTSFKTDRYNLVFTPFHGDVTFNVATNITREQVMGLMESLNEPLEVLREEISDPPSV